VEQNFVAVRVPDTAEYCRHGERPLECSVLRREPLGKGRKVDLEWFEPASIMACQKLFLASQQPDRCPLL